MTITVSRVPTKKPGPISLGSKIFRFRLPHQTRRFTVHEDLICATSHLFRHRLQKNRKPLLPTDDCPVCVSPLDATTADITFCVKCGQNVHEPCVEAWKRQQGKRGLELGVGVSVATCPMCRSPWKNEPLLKYLSVEGNGEAEAVQGYLEWLYSGRGEVTTQDVHDNALKLLQFWEVADTLQDIVFLRAVMLPFLTHRVELGPGAVAWVFVDHRGSNDMRTFLLELFMCDMQPGWFVGEAAKWPTAFVHALADKAMATCHFRQTREQLKQKYLSTMAAEEHQAVESEASILALPTESDNNGEEVRIVGKKPNIILRGQYVTTVVDAETEATVNRFRTMPTPATGGEGDGSVGGRRVRARIA